MRQITRAGPALATLLIGLAAATGSFWFLGQETVMATVVGWFASWLIIWTSLPMFGRAFHLDL